VEALKYSRDGISTSNWIRGKGNSMLSWLRGLSVRETSPDIFDLNVTGYGPAEVGPHGDLREKRRSAEVAKTYGDTLMEAHHIVESEHLAFARVAFRHHDAPSVLIPADMHRKLINSRFIAELNSFGGRRGGLPEMSRAELLSLYRAIYTWHTPFRELFRIVQNIL
jgi:hypothetical protein